MVATSIESFDENQERDDNEPMLRLGFPVQPHIQNTLFPSNFLVANNRVLEQILRDRSRDSILRGSTLELHYQTIEGFVGLDRKDKIDVRSIVNRLKRRGYQFMIHHPFLRQKGEGPFNMDFVWHTVPAQYRSDDGQEGVPVTHIMDKLIYAEEVRLDLSKRFLEYCDFLGVRNVTIHVTKPGTVLAEEDFKDYSAKIGELVTYIQRQGLDVAIAVETGGITPNQLLRLNADHGTYINLDVAHFFLDLDTAHPGKFYQKKRRDVVDFFRDYREIIPQLHLTETHSGDQHLPIHEKGILNPCNQSILQIMQDDLRNGKTYLAMVESEYNPRDAAYIRQVLSDPRITPLQD
ncbi:hypothetical protein COV17_00055 [Candidatus Woesearchaeota archaeon CG10_big_fil_rev_8_21_14_0_10_36_11]|nr:MAG: hypothetical protein COV17_00055 [Candidatus Woesearchaeota archaeon CG10_big_fil_rev_8_21_14_0_10_36_11]